MNLEFYQEICERYQNIKFHNNPSSGSQAVPEGQKDMAKLILALRNYANAPKNESCGNRMSGCGPHSSGSGQ
jgi:hypothetical protein